jgi:sugar phosphate permease
MISAAEYSERRWVVVLIILGYAGFTAAIGVCVWVYMPDRLQQGAATASAARRPSARQLCAQVPMVLRMPTLWLQVAIIIPVYVCSTGALEVFGLYCIQEYGLSESAAVWMVTLFTWLKPPGATLAGWVADRAHAGKVVFAFYVVQLVSFAAIASTPGTDLPNWGKMAVLAAMVASSGTAIVGVRACYFTVLREARVPAELTGTAVGVVSTLGFTPDIYAGVMAGALLDAYPGTLGFRYFYGVLSLLGLAGAVASVAFVYTTTRRTSVGDGVPVGKYGLVSRAEISASARTGE